MKFLVFFRTKDMSVSLYANRGNENDTKEFIKIVSDKISGNNFSNSDSISESLSESCSCNDLLEYDSYIYLERIFVCKIQTGIKDINEFKELIKYLCNFYYVYED